uniref:GHMP kinase C-terminal domain-containing protein n=1 Tax=Quercus lobata TaxID=97700 RepID=A0A7N2RCY0_QUELO
MHPPSVRSDEASNASKFENPFGFPKRERPIGREPNDWELGVVDEFLCTLGSNLPQTKNGDRMRWKLTKNGDFDIRSFYNKLRVADYLDIFSEHVTWTPRFSTFVPDWELESLMLFMDILYLGVADRLIWVASSLKEFNGIIGYICGSEGLDSSGLSSSAAVGIAYLLALESANHLTVSLTENIEYDWDGHLCQAIFYKKLGMEHVKFWKLQWSGKSSLAICYLELFRICSNKEASVADLMHFTNGVLHWDLHIFIKTSDPNIPANYNCQKYIRYIENEYLGLRNGILDQSAILLSRQGCLTFMNCKTKEHKLVHPPKPPKTYKTESQKAYKILLAFSGLKQALTTNPGYNRRVAECQEAARIILNKKSMINAVKCLEHKGDKVSHVLLETTKWSLSYQMAIQPEDYEAHKSQLEPYLAKRAEHYFSENKRVIKGAEAWASGKLEDFGKLVSASGLSSISKYESGCEPLIQLYEILLRAPGVFGTRFSGAGFRGCCLAFVDADRADEAASFIREEYRKVQPKLASQINDKEVMICEAGDCARVI